MTRSPAPPDVSPDLRDLFTIDVASELRKLGEAQLQGPWQLPAELVRRALRSGASRVDVRFGRGSVLVEDDGPGMDPEVLVLLGTLIDRRRSNQERHQALAGLERAGELALLALAGLARTPDLDIETTHANGRYTLAVHRKIPSGVAFSAAGSGVLARGTRIRLKAPQIDLRRARHWLEEVARFSPVPVTLDGNPVADGFSGCLLEAPLGPPFVGRVAFLPQGESAEVHLLVCGLVVADFAAPGGIAFEAAVELGASVRDLGAARLREEFLPQVPALVEAAVDLLARGGQAVAARSEADRARLARLVLRAAGQVAAVPRLQGVAVFRALEEGRPRLLALMHLRAQVAPGRGTARNLWVLPAEERSDRFVLPAEPVVIASAAEQSLLSEILGVGLVIPTRRGSGGSMGAWLRRSARAMGTGASRLLDLARSPFSPRVLSEPAWTEPERALLLALRKELQARPGWPRDALLCAGSGAIRRRGGRRPAFVLPRDNPVVRASVRAFATDPRWLRPIYLCLSAGPP